MLLLSQLHSYNIVMPSEEAKEWLEMLGVKPGEGGGLGALIRATYKTLGLQTYFTTGACRVVAVLCSLRVRERSSFTVVRERLAHISPAAETPLLPFCCCLTPLLPRRHTPNQQASTTCL
jgi:hypothetical protein